MFPLVPFTLLTLRIGKPELSTIFSKWLNKELVTTIETSRSGFTRATRSLMSLIEAIPFAVASF